VTLYSINNYQNKIKLHHPQSQYRQHRPSMTPSSLDLLEPLKPRFVQQQNLLRELFPAFLP